MKAVLALDLGGTVVKAGVVDPSGTVHSVATRPSAERDGVDAWAAAAIEAARSALSQSQVAPTVIGIAVPGAVDPTTATLVDLVDRLDAGKGLDLAHVFAPLGLPVRADNDARAALGAELRWGGFAGASDLVLLTVGTGIGGAAVVGGRAPGGDPILAGNQLGHLTIEMEGRRCVCGNRGCAETVASASALVADAARRGVDAPDATAVFDADAAGNPAAAAAIDRFIAGLAATVVNAIHAYQPSAVVLSGGVLARADRILPGLRSLVDEHAWTVPRRRVTVAASRLGAEAPLLAGAAVALA